MAALTRAKDFQTTGPDAGSMSERLHRTMHKFIRKQLRKHEYWVVEDGSEPAVCVFRLPTVSNNETLMKLSPVRTGPCTLCRWAHIGPRARTSVRLCRWGTKHYLYDGKGVYQTY